MSGSMRLGALALAVVMLLTACATVAPSGGGLDEDLDEGEAVFSNLPTDFQPVQVGDSDFTAALTTFWLQVPLRVSASCPPLYVGRRLALASAPSSGEAWQSDLAQSYGGFCERRGTPGDCLTLFDDGPRLQADDKRSMALAVAVGPALEGVDAEVRAMLNPTRVLATLSFTITAYMALLLAPEPVTKGVATAFSVLMWGYLGWEFFDLLRAYARLYEDAPRASTFAELREVGERFGRVIGPNSLRILVMVATAAVGETAALMSKGPKLPGFGQASRTVEANTGLRLMDAATGAERVLVSVNEGTIRVVLPVNAVSMTARNDGGGGRPVLDPNGPPKEGLLAGAYRAFRSFRAFKRNMGKAGEGKEWHHLVEKHGFNLKRFGAEALHNTENVIPLEKGLHTKVSAFYSTESQEWRLVKKLEDLVADFAENVMAQSEAIRRGDAKTGNKHANRYTAALMKLRSAGDAGRDALAVLLEHPRADVRVMAAAFLLRYRTAEAKAVLEVAAKGDGLSSLGAIMTLKRWEDGTWNLDPEDDG